MAARNTFKCNFRANGKIVHSGITTDLARRKTEHQIRWPEGCIEKVGTANTHRKAWYWAKEQTERCINAAS